MLTSLAAAAGEPAAVPMHAETHQVEDPQKTYAGGYLTYQGTGMLLGLVISVLTIVGFVRKWRSENLTLARENEARQQQREDRMMGEISKHNDTVEKRLTTVETKCIDYMPRTEIEAKIEHEKNNRLAGNQAVQRTLERHDDGINALRVEVGGIAVQITNSHAAVHRVETQLEKLCEKVDKLVART